MYYILMKALEDDETQKKGVIICTLSIGESVGAQQHDVVFAYCGLKIRDSLPYKIAGQHLCSNPSTIAGLFQKSVMKLVNIEDMLRTRFHRGTFPEIEQSLATFGIRGADLVMTYNGEFKLEKHKETIKMFQTTVPSQQTDGKRLVVSFAF